MADAPATVRAAAAVRTAAIISDPEKRVAQGFLKEALRGLFFVLARLTAARRGEYHRKKKDTIPRKGARPAAWRAVKQRLRRSVRFGEKPSSGAKRAPETGGGGRSKVISKKQGGILRPEGERLCF